ncbi:hypothetical protein QJ854_gp825 [Moumouvirus goulette]|uniref:Uncharacterized protein n=1 Tax=Moumouvirus goulette TaxID=1247379 RepID=M1PW49_9VIRU|nr:hypothetical protein QJ854_gp825 [Moumouvirus goulette]AGF84957.1 hypothetical protein glt_00148 [Moumouvirus goulette]
MNINKLSTFNNTIEEINELVPKIFRDKISRINFTSGFDNSFGIDLYSEISSFCYIEFNVQDIIITLHIDYVIYKSNDWNEEEPYIILGILKIHQKNYHIKYSCTNEKIKDKNIIVTKINKTNRLLKLLNLEISTHNIKMLEILINNLVWKTKVMCNLLNNNIYTEKLINANFI